MPAASELAYADDYRFQPDPVLLLPHPQGRRVRASRSRTRSTAGREDFVYRITIGELPFVTSVFPLGGRAGAKTTVELTGWNLPRRLA